MADKLVTKATGIYYNGYDIAAESSAVALTYGIEEVGADNFGANYKDWEPGLHHCRGTVDVMLATDHLLEAAQSAGVGVGTNLLAFLVGGSTAGSIAFALSGLSLNRRRGFQIGQLYSSALDISCKGTPLVRGKLLEAVTSRSASADTTGIQFTGGVSSTQRLYIAYHVTQMTATNLAAVLQRDDNSGFTSATTAITLTTATGITREFASVAGAITDDWYRLSFTLTGAGSYTAVAVIAVQ
jgi:hypothetical protein